MGRARKEFAVERCRDVLLKLARRDDNVDDRDSTWQIEITRVIRRLSLLLDASPPIHLPVYPVG